ncbi:MAG TPA: hypothetical protein VIQ05_03710, partial [Tardiphaga sp.]
MRMLRVSTPRARIRMFAAAALAALLLPAVLPSAASAQSQGGPFSLFDNIFGGSPPPQAALPPT